MPAPVPARHARAPRVLVALAAAGLAAVPAAAGAPTRAAATAQSLAIPGRVLFDGGWESGGNGGWGYCQTRHAGGVRAVAAPRRTGRAAGRFEVTDGDFDGFGERSECQADTGERNGQVRWYSWSTYIPRDLPPANARAWAVITQWHCNCDGSPPVGFFLQSDRLQLSIHRRGRVSDVQPELVAWGVPLSSVRGRWTDIRMRVRWSYSDRTGFVDLWVNGIRQRMNWPDADLRASRYGGVGAARLRVRTLVPGTSGNYLKQGLYRSRSIGGRAVVYHDAMRISAG